MRIATCIVRKLRLRLSFFTTFSELNGIRDFLIKQDSLVLLNKYKSFEGTYWEPQAVSFNFTKNRNLSIEFLETLAFFHCAMSPGVKYSQTNCAFKVLKADYGFNR